MQPRTQGQPSIELLELMGQQIAVFLQAYREQQKEPQRTEPEAPGDETFDVKGAAAYLRVSNWTIYDMVRTKTIPHFRIRSRVFFRRRELDQWISQQQTQNCRQGG